MHCPKSVGRSAVLLLPLLAAPDPARGGGDGADWSPATPYPGQTLWCGYCSACGPGLHSFTVSAISFTYAGGDHSCYISPSSCPHPICGIGTADATPGDTLAAGQGAELAFSAAATKLSEGGEQALRAASSLLTRFPTRITLHRQRSVLQLRASCDANIVIAQVALDPGFVERLEDQAGVTPW